ncbi:unnamed protein product [Pleuronectes platessa]|uniref:Uncharacterized protein n=1 Tax=Pleuronectes platessa TaxID=8262 RepID=A0A9N7Y6P9_PLEPL|nr:unnamed protein product [Pleuronectes platessa]
MLPPSAARTLPTSDLRSPGAAERSHSSSNTIIWDDSCPSTCPDEVLARSPVSLEPWTDLPGTFGRGLRQQSELIPLVSNSSSSPCQESSGNTCEDDSGYTREFRMQNDRKEERKERGREDDRKEERKERWREDDRKENRKERWREDDAMDEVSRRGKFGAMTSEHRTQTLERARGFCRSRLGILGN